MSIDYVIDILERIFKKAKLQLELFFIEKDQRESFLRICTSVVCLKFSGLHKVSDNFYFIGSITLCTQIGGDFKSHYFIFDSGHDRLIHYSTSRDLFLEVYDQMISTTLMEVEQSFLDLNFTTDGLLEYREKRLLQIKNLRTYKYRFTTLLEEE